MDSASKLKLAKDVKMMRPEVKVSQRPPPFCRSDGITYLELNHSCSSKNKNLSTVYTIMIDFASSLLPPILFPFSIDKVASL